MRNETQLIPSFGSFNAGFRSSTQPTCYETALNCKFSTPLAVFYKTFRSTDYHQLDGDAPITALNRGVGEVMLISEKPME